MKSNEEWSSQLCFICIIHLHIFHGNIWTHNWPAPNVSGFIAQLVERRTGIPRSRVQAPLKSWIFFRLLYAIVKIAITTARIILHLIIDVAACSWGSHFRGFAWRAGKWGQHFFSQFLVHPPPSVYGCQRKLPHTRHSTTRLAIFRRQQPWSRNVIVDFRPSKGVPRLLCCQRCPKTNFCFRNLY